MDLNVNSTVLSRFLEAINGFDAETSASTEILNRWSMDQVQCRTFVTLNLQFEPKSDGPCPISEVLFMKF